jgi:hypothetical protein
VAWDNVLLYAKAGAAGMNAGYATDIQGAGVVQSQTVSDRRIGWTAGGGIEVGFFYGGVVGQGRIRLLTSAPVNTGWHCRSTPPRHVRVVKAGINWRINTNPLAIVAWLRAIIEED